MLIKNIKKKDLIKNISFKTGLSYNLSKKIFSDLVSALINNINNGGLILKNIGSFRIIDKKQRIGRNPKTREEFLISSRKTISFTPSKKINKILKELE